MMGKQTVSVTLSTDVIKELDNCAKFIGLNRSAFLEWVLRNTLPTIPEITAKMKESFKARVKAFWEWL